MAQFYFLSILSNIVAGLTLAGDYLGEKIPFLASFKNLRANRPATVTIGIVTVLIGVIKLHCLFPVSISPSSATSCRRLPGLSSAASCWWRLFGRRSKARESP